MAQSGTLAGKTPSADNRILAQIVRRLVSHCQPDKIYLFGSAARGDAGPDSDYDIMVVVPDDASPERRDCGKAYLTLCGLGIAKDVVVWTRSDFEEDLSLRASFPSTVVREGKLLYDA